AVVDDARGRELRRADLQPDEALDLMVPAGMCRLGRRLREGDLDVAEPRPGLALALRLRLLLGLRLLRLLLGLRLLRLRLADLTLPEGHLGLGLVDSRSRRWRHRHGGRRDLGERLGRELRPREPRLVRVGL